MAIGGREFMLPNPTGETRKKEIPLERDRTRIPHVVFRGPGSSDSTQDSEQSDQGRTSPDTGDEDENELALDRREQEERWHRAWQSSDIANED